MIAYLVQEIEARAALIEPLHANSKQVFRKGSLGVGNVPEHPDFPYVVLGELPGDVFGEVRKISSARTRVFQFWCYDRMGDYDVIERVLAEFRKVVNEIAPFWLPDGTICSEAQNLSTSGDLTDPQYDGGMMFTLARFVVNK